MTTATSTRTAARVVDAVKLYGAGDTLSFSAGGSGLSPQLAGAIGGLPEVDTAVGLGRGGAEVNGLGRALTVTDPTASPAPSISTRSRSR